MIPHARPAPLAILGALAPRLDRGLLVLVVVGILLSALLDGCGLSALDQAQVATTTTARAFVEVDRAFADQYVAASREARASAPEGPEGWAVRDAAMGAWDRAQDGVDAAVRAILTAQLALDASREAKSEDWRAALPCAVAAVGASVELLEGLDLELPAILYTGLGALEALLGRCDSEPVDPEPEAPPQSPVSEVERPPNPGVAHG